MKMQKLTDWPTERTTESIIASRQPDGLTEKLLTRLNLDRISD